MKRKKFLYGLMAATMITGAVISPVKVVAQTTESIPATPLEPAIPVEQEKTPYEIFDKNANAKYQVKETTPFDLKTIQFEIIYQDGSRDTISGSDVSFSLDMADYKYAVVNNDKTLTFTDYAPHEREVPVKVSYTKNSKTVETSIVVRHTLGEDKLPQYPKKIILVNDKYELIELEEGDDFDLTDLDFEVEYESGITKRLSYSDFTDVKISKKHSSLGSINKKYFSFNRKADVGDEVDITFCYEENNVEKDFTITFELVKEGTTIVNKEPESIELISVDGKDYDYKETIKIDRGDEFELEDLEFLVTFENGAEREIDGSEISKSNYKIPSKQKNLVTISSSLELEFKDDANVGDIVTIEVQFTHEGETVKTKIDFELTGDAKIGKLTPEKNFYHIGIGEEFDLTDIDFVYYESSKKKNTYSVPDVKYEISSTEKKKIDLDKHTFSFKDTVKNGDYITIEFSRKIDGKTKKTEVKFIYDTTSTGSTGNQIVTPKNFSDIGGHWAEQDILELAKRNMVVGYSNGKYYPNKAITRGEVAAFISRYLDLEMGKKDARNPFIDVAPYTTYSNEILAVAEAGIIKGYDDLSFKPEQTISRQELAVILLRTYKENKNLTQVTPSKVPFADQAIIAGWAKQSVMEAKALGLIGGKSYNMFDPQGATTRAEMSSLIWRMYTK